MAVAVGSVIALAPVASGSGDASAGAPTTEPLVSVVNSSREAMRAGYLGTLKPALQTPIGWTGNVGTCTAGAPSQAAQASTLTALNYFRSLAGLQPVKFDKALSASAQQAALMMLAKWELSHFPDPNWPCYTASGSAAAGRSSLHLGRSGAGAILGYMTDAGSNNLGVGHRFGMMQPRQTTMGSGSTLNSNALHLSDLGTYRPGPLPSDPEFVSWPTPGYFPTQIEPLGRWSLFSFGTKDLTAATVRVTMHQGSKSVAVPARVVYRSSADLVWEIDPDFVPGNADRTYSVRVGSISDFGATSVTSYEYDVTLFDPEVDLERPA